MQIIHFNWEDDDSTRSLNHQRLGMNQPGRYRGFDADLAASTGMTLKLEHDITGFDVTLDGPTFPVERRGVILTKQGAVIHETEGLEIVGIAVGDATHPRIDLIVCEHEYVDVQDGSVAIYYSIPGTPSATPVAPALTAPSQIKIIIGELYVPSGTTALSGVGVTFTQHAAPNFANDPNIMKTHLDQHSTGQKRFDSILQTVVLADYVGGGTNVLDLQGSKSNDFFLADQGFSFYVEIKDIINPGVSAEGYRFRLKCIQPVYFTPNSVISTPNNKTLYIEAGEEVEVFDFYDMLAPNPVHYWRIAKGGEAIASRENKFRFMQSFCQGTNTAASSTLQLPRDGNLYIITGGANWTLNSISNHHPEQFFLFSPPNEFGGAFVFLKVKTSPAGGNITIAHNVASTGQQKKILTITGSNMVVKDDSLLMFIEFADRYELVSVADPNTNVWTLLQTITALQASVTPETWKLVGAGGNMANGQPVPAFSGTCANQGATQPLRLRKIGDEVQIQGVVTNTGVITGSASFTCFTLPVGYRPPNTIYLYEMVKDGSGSGAHFCQFTIDGATGVVTGSLTTTQPAGGVIFYSFNFKLPLT